MENSKDFAEEVLDSTGTLATEKFKKGEKFVKDIIEAKTQVRLKSESFLSDFLVFKLKPIDLIFICSLYSSTRMPLRKLPPS